MKLLLQGKCVDLLKEINEIKIGLYLFEIREGYCKFGKSINLLNRISTHLDYNPDARVAIFDIINDVHKDESNCLYKIKEHFQQRKGEWIFLPFEQLLSFIENLQFSNIPIEEIPIATTKITKVSRRNPVPPLKASNLNLPEEDFIFTKEHRMKMRESALKRERAPRKPHPTKFIKDYKMYKFISPDGNLTIVEDLRSFCKLNDLHAGTMCSMHQNKGRRSHKGWTRYQDPELPEPKYISKKQYPKK